MQWPLMTGEVRKNFFPDTREHTLNNFIRLGKLNVQLVCGRRTWFPQDVERAARLLGKDTIPLRNLLRAEQEASK